MFPQWPYVNDHEINLNWIIRVVQDFQAKYTNVEAAIDEAIKQITESGQASMQEMEAAKQSILAAINAAQTASTTAINQAGAAAQQSVTTARDAALADVAALISALPQDYADIVGKMVIISGMLQMVPDTIPQWVQGNYTNGTLNSADTTRATSYIFVGCGGLVLTLKNNVPGQEIKAVRFFTGHTGDTWTGMQVIGPQNVQYLTVQFPQNAYAYTVEVGNTNNTAISPTAVNVSFSWMSAIDTFNKAFSKNVFSPAMFENGAIGAANGVPTNSVERVRTKGYLPRYVKNMYSSDPNIRFFLYAYNPDGSYAGGWIGDRFTNDANPAARFDMDNFYNNPAYANYSYKVSIRLAGGAVQVETMANIFMDNYLLFGTDASLSVAGMAADAKATGEALQDAQAFAQVYLGNAYNINSPGIWEQGAISTGNGRNAANNERVRTAKYLPTSVDEIIMPNTRGFFILAYTVTEQYIGAYKSDGTFVTDGSESGYNQFRISDLQAAFPQYRFRLSVYPRTSSPINVSEAGGWVLSNRLMRADATKVRVMQYNIGKFNYGNAGGLPVANVADKLAGYNRFFSEYQPDIVCMQEYTDFIGAGDTYPAADYLFTPIYFYSSHEEREIITYSQYPTSNSAFTYIHQSGDYPSWIVYSDVMIANRLVRVVSGVINVADTLEERQRALTKLTGEILANSQYAIVCMDFNPLNISEADAMRDQMLQAGFTGANWQRRWGYVPTYRENTTAYRAIDNIMVKGNIKLLNAFVPPVYDQLSSDHLPLLVDMEII